MTIEAFRKLALSYPEASEQPHFEKTSFRVGKKIFATLDTSNQLACLKLTDQDLFSLIDREIIYPVPNKWGKMGWTNFDISKAEKNVVSDALKCAYLNVAPKKLGEQVKQ